MAFWATAAFAQAPKIGVPDGAEVTHERAVDLDDYALPVAAFGTAAPIVTLTGKVVRRSWRISAAERTVTSVMTGYRRAMERQGFRRLLDCKTAKCGGFDFRFDAELLPPPAMTMDVRNFAQLSVGKEGPAGYGSILVSQVRDQIYVQAVTVVPEDSNMALAGSPLEPLPETVPQGAEDAGTAGTADPPATEDGTAGSTDPARDTATPAPEIASDDVPDDGRPLLDRLLEYGHVPVAGLAFASGGSKLTEDSGAALDEMAKMLVENPDLKVAIVGHSDNRGPLNVNIELSRRRAAAVRAALIERGVKAAGQNIASGTI